MSSGGADFRMSLHFLRIELEEVGDDFGFGRVVRKAAAKMAAFPVNAAITGKAAF